MKRTLAAVTLLVTAVAPPAVAQLRNVSREHSLRSSSVMTTRPNHWGDVDWVRDGGSYVMCRTTGVTER